MNWFYTSELIPDSKEFTLSEEESKHACKVLRLKNGNQLSLLNGKGSSFLAKITDDNPKRCKLEMVSHSYTEKLDYQIHIAISPTKNLDRLEWFFEKATEIGVDEISLVYTKNTERKVVKNDRLEKILVAAMKQSQRKYLPKLNEMITLDKFLESHSNGAVAHCIDSSKSDLNSCLEKSNFPILIGPEGDFTPEEINMILKKGYTAITLGENRLRTETAGLYACMLAKTILS